MFTLGGRWPGRDGSNNWNRVLRLYRKLMGPRLRWVPVLLRIGNYQSCATIIWSNSGQIHTGASFWPAPPARRNCQALSLALRLAARLRNGFPIPPLKVQGDLHCTGRVASPKLPINQTLQTRTNYLGPTQPTRPRPRTQIPPISWVLLNVWLAVLDLPSIEFCLPRRDVPGMVWNWNKSGLDWSLSPGQFSSYSLEADSPVPLSAQSEQWTVIRCWRN